jgi:hypothetical protein
MWTSPSSACRKSGTCGHQRTEECCSAQRGSLRAHPTRISGGFRASSERALRGRRRRYSVASTRRVGVLAVSIAQAKRRPFPSSIIEHCSVDRTPRAKPHDSGNVIDRSAVDRLPIELHTRIRRGRLASHTPDTRQSQPSFPYGATLAEQLGCAISPLT